MPNVRAGRFVIAREILKRYDHWGRGVWAEDGPVPRNAKREAHSVFSKRYVTQDLWNSSFLCFMLNLQAKRASQLWSAHTSDPISVFFLFFDSLPR